MALRALILGAAAGGGLPQWNCSGANSAPFWRGGAEFPYATQSSLAVNAGGSGWAVCNASPDIRAQIMACPDLQPREAREAGLRNSPISSVMLTNGDIDHIAGLLSLREKQAFDLFMTAEIAEVLDANPIFSALDPAFVQRRRILLEEPFELLPGVTALLFAVPGKVPLFMEGAEVVTDLEGEQTVGVEISGGTSTLHYIPGCARMTAALAERLKGAQCILFDGTLWTDDEMIEQGLGQKTGKRMGHMSMSGEEGSIAAFAELDVGRKIFVHINNSNPVWRDGPERAEAEAAGWEIAHDGMEIVL